MQAPAFLCVVLCGVALGAAAPAGQAPEATPFYSSSFDRMPTAAQLTSLGRALFVDPGLSASGKMSCATCHDPKRDFAAPNDLAVQRGGSDGRSFGVRAVPSLKYSQNIPPFTEHYVDDEGDDGIDQGPAGGRTWDGRSQSAHEQARLPLLSPFEMANSSAAAVVYKVRRAAYAANFRAAFGARVLDGESSAFKAVLLALETYQQDPEDFYPYSSKYDAWLRHAASLSAAEMRGLAVFNDPAKGNCARCHPSAMRKGALPQFSDFGYAAIGVPRNAAIPANQDPNYVDLGLCGPLRTDLAARQEFCGLFRTPTLRNAARRGAFFHNGVVHSLERAVLFYAERDTSPQRWYPRAADGRTLTFDDLPARYLSNIDVEPPLNRHRGEPPALTESEVADIVAFLRTLSDGYQSH